MKRKSCSQARRAAEETAAAAELARLSKRLRDRAFLLHDLCSEVARLIACGSDRGEAFAIVLCEYKRTRKTRGPLVGRFALCRKSLYRHFARWSAHPSPAVFIVRWKGGRP